MATLKHEVWRDPDGLETCCLAGPMGDGARGLLAKGSRLVCTFEAGSYFEAMTKLYEYQGRGVSYETEHDWDRQPYPEEWLAAQR